MTFTKGFCSGSLSLILPVYVLTMSESSLCHAYLSSMVHFNLGDICSNINLWLTVLSGVSFTCLSTSEAGNVQSKASFTYLSTSEGENLHSEASFT